MAEFKVSSDMLRNSASEIKTYSGNFSSLMGEVTQGLTGLGAVWEGEAFNQFKAQVDALNPSVEAYARVINEYGQFLETAAEQYEQTEQAAQSETDQLANNLFQG